MKTIALLTDFGADSFYVGAMKAVLAARASGAVVVDVTHGIAPQQILQAGFVLDRVFDWFAPGTVFVVVVDPGVGTSRRALVLEFGGRTVVAPDNGVAWEVVARHTIIRPINIDKTTLAPYRAHAPMGGTFHGRDVFAPAAAALASGVEASALGTVADAMEQPESFPAVIRGDGVVRGAGRFVDAFGNILSNIAASDLTAVFGERFRDAASVRVEGRDVGRLRDVYAGGERGRLMAVLNSWDLVEVASNRGRAVDAFAVAPVESIRFEVTASP
jgi:S-adenosylmethionine hydrolase